MSDTYDVIPLGNGQYEVEHHSDWAGGILTLGIFAIFGGILYLLFLVVAGMLKALWDAGKYTGFWVGLYLGVWAGAILSCVLAFLTWAFGFGARPLCVPVLAWGLGWVVTTTLFRALLCWGSPGTFTPVTIDEPQRQALRGGAFVGLAVAVAFSAMLAMPPSHADSTVVLAESVPVTIPTPGPIPTPTPTATPVDRELQQMIDALHPAWPLPTPVRVERAQPVRRPSSAEPVMRRYVRNGKSAQEQAEAVAMEGDILVKTIKGREYYWVIEAKKWRLLGNAD